MKYKDYVIAFFSGLTKGDAKKIASDSIDEQKGVADGLATLNSSGQVPSQQLPSYVDDVLEFSSFDNFPLTGQTGKIYIDLNTGNTYRWGGSTYIEVSAGIKNLVDGAGTGSVKQISANNDEEANYAFSEGLETQTLANYTHAEGYYTIASGEASHSECYDTRAEGAASHAEGTQTSAEGDHSHAEGYQTQAEGEASHAQGNQTSATGDYSHAEGSQSRATGDYSHAQGYSSTAAGPASHAQGEQTYSPGWYSHAQGCQTSAEGNSSHSEGFETSAEGNHSHAQGSGTSASGGSSHAGGHRTEASRWAQTAIGEWNVVDNVGSSADQRGKYVFIIGNGSNTDARSNAFTVDWDGNVEIAGTPTNNNHVITKGYAESHFSNTSGTVESVGITAGAGMSVSGSPITTTGSITVGHSNSITAQNTQGIYPISIDGQGHITGYGTAVVPLTATSNLDASKLTGTIPTANLPSYVDDVISYANQSSFPATGQTGKIYVDESTNLTFRWSGSGYVQISPSLALGTTSSTAYRGDYGNAAYAHAVTNKGSAFTSGLYKITTNSEGHVTAATAVQKSDITGLGIPGSVPTISDTYDSTSSNGMSGIAVASALSNLGAGTITSITAGAGLNGGTITSTGTISSKNSNLINGTGTNSLTSLKTEAAYTDQFVIGKYNNNLSNSAFEIGNGSIISYDVNTGETTFANSNALTVDWDGNAKLSGSLTVANHNSKIGSLLDNSDSTNISSSAQWQYGMHRTLPAGSWVLVGNCTIGESGTDPHRIGLRIVEGEVDTSKTQPEVSNIVNIGCTNKIIISGVDTETNLNVSAIVTHNTAKTYVLEGFLGTGASANANFTFRLKAMRIE